MTRASRPLYVNRGHAHAVMLASGAALIATSIVQILIGALAHNTFTVTGLYTAALGIALLIQVHRFYLPSAVGRYADEIRDKVDAEAGSERVVIEGADQVHFHGPIGTAHGDVATARASESIQKQEAILREIYTEGLAQARSAFNLSKWFAGIGGALMFGGIVLAIAFAPTSGKQFAAIVSGAAGVVVNLTSSLFFVQSNRMKKTMVKQGAALREESQEDRRLNASRELVAAIDDVTLRDTTRAKLALRLLEANGHGTTSDDPSSQTTEGSGSQANQP